jgi:hypothetical protein
MAVMTAFAPASIAPKFTVPVIPGKPQTTPRHAAVIETTVAVAVYVSAEQLMWLGLCALWLAAVVEMLAYRPYIHGMTLQLFTISTIAGAIIAVTSAAYVLRSAQANTDVQTSE